MEAGGAGAQQGTEQSEVLVPGEAGIAGSAKDLGLCFSS